VFCCQILAKNSTNGQRRTRSVCYEWQVNNLEFDSWPKKLSEQLSKIGLGYIWQDLRVNTVSGICKKK
jgi:hypothetical protein